MAIDKLNYTDKAEDVIFDLAKDKYGNIKRDTNGKLDVNLTTSKIRNILSMVSALYNDIQRYKEKELSEEFLSRIQYLKMRIAYEAGRERSVEDFVKKANLMTEIKKIGTSKDNLILFCNYMEALVAYHKFYGGKD